MGVCDPGLQPHGRYTRLPIYGFVESEPAVSVHQTPTYLWLCDQWLNSHEGYTRLPIYGCVESEPALSVHCTLAHLRLCRVLVDPSCASYACLLTVVCELNPIFERYSPFSMNTRLTVLDCL
jgi:hypothetical protein